LVELGGGGGRVFEVRGLVGGGGQVEEEKSVRDKALIGLPVASKETL
jgi:hypothetical protein